MSTDFLGHIEEVSRDREMAQVKAILGGGWLGPLRSWELAICSFRVERNKEESRPSISQVLSTRKQVS